MHKPTTRGGEADTAQRSPLRRRQTKISNRDARPTKNLLSRRPIPKATVQPNAPNLISDTSKSQQREAEKRTLNNCTPCDAARPKFLTETPAGPKIISRDVRSKKQLYSPMHQNLIGRHAKAGNERRRSGHCTTAPPATPPDQNF
jgi:hypothetical protein